MGADAGSRIFYNRVKGELERDLRAQGFASLTFVRPGLISGPRTEHRPGERLMVGLLGTLGPLLPRRWRLNPAHRIAQALIEAAVSARPGVHTVGSGALAE
jgi:uncharacterized protein YbjT (DUF2867 family)